MSVEEELREAVTNDRRIEQESQSKTLALMEHRFTSAQKFGLREYARALGRRESTVHAYAAGWGIWQSWAGVDGVRVDANTPSDALELAKLSAEKQAAHEVVAAAKGVGIQTVRQRYRPDVQRVEQAMRDEPDPERKVEKGRRLAELIERTRRNEAERRANRSEFMWWMDLEQELYKMRSAGSAALTIARDVDWDAEHVEMLADSLTKIKALLGLLNLAVVGTADVDWDAELTRLTE